MDELNIQIDELVVGPDADLLGQIRAALGDRVSLQVAEDIRAAVEASRAQYTAEHHRGVLP
jgi:hypothetical protein